MSATVAPTATDRSDFRTVLIAGTKLGVGITVAVVLYLVAARGLRSGGVVEGLLVLAAAAAATFLPGAWSVARTVEGIAGAAAIGLWGSIVFSVLDVALLRPVHAYPWTWDAVGGGTTWWYLPVWWMLATFLAWMGGVVIAAAAGRRGASLGRAVGPVVVVGVALAAGVRLAGLTTLLPVAVGLGFIVALVAFVVVALARRT